MTNKQTKSNAKTGASKRLSLGENSFPQTTELLRWVEEQRKNGLTDVKFFARRGDDSTVESFCGDVNQLLKAPVVTDTDLL